MKAILRFDNVDVYREGEFADTEPVTIGREPDNKVAMQLGVLSRHHAKVFFENGSWYVQDLDSANGSFFRGKQLAPNVKTELVNGDIVHFGTVAMSICLAIPSEVKVVEKIVEKPVEKIVEKVVEVCPPMCREPMSTKAVLPVGGVPPLRAPGTMFERVGRNRLAALEEAAQRELAAANKMGKGGSFGLFGGKR